MSEIIETAAPKKRMLSGIQPSGDLHLGNYLGAIKNWAIDRTFKPAIAEADRVDRIKGWNKAVKCAYGWAKD